MAAGNYGAKSYQYDALGNIRQKDGLNYSYYDGTNGAGPHAVKYSGSFLYNYDANGNMIKQVGDGIHYFTYDAQNRLEEYSKVGQSNVYFKYDESGERTRKEQGGLVTRFAGGLYEDNTTGMKWHVFAGGLRVAEITPSAVRYVHPDHLGGTNVVTDETGTLVLEVAEYTPFGEFSPAADDEGYYYTGQYRDSCQWPFKNVPIMAMKSVPPAGVIHRLFTLKRPPFVVCVL